MTGILRFILIAILVSWLLQLLFRLIGPPLLEKWMKKKFSQFNEQQPQNKQTKKEGEVTIDKNQKKSKKVDPKEGDYIDFEEIE